tara:strand:+ start:167 stop:289 length:123 start_codon:yes stop_codon:yes gene_type:complete
MKSQQHGWRTLERLPSVLLAPELALVLVLALVLALAARTP